MSNPTFVAVNATQTADVATNGTITLAYPATYSSSNVLAAGAYMYCAGLGNMLLQGATHAFTVAYGGSIVITYTGLTTIPAGSKIDFYLPIPDAESAITDSSGGTASETIAAFTQPDLSAWDGAHDPTAAQKTAIQAAFTVLLNAVSSLAAKQAKMQTALKNANINPV